MVDRIAAAAYKKGDVNRNLVIASWAREATDGVVLVLSKISRLPAYHRFSELAVLVAAPPPLTGGLVKS